MSDILKTQINPMYSTSWEQGEQPSSIKYRAIFSTYSASIANFCKLLGPLVNDNNLITTRNRVLSARSFGELSDGSKASYKNDLKETFLNTFNIARVIGPHLLINPIYIPGSTHSKESQSSAWPLAENTKVQSLPFPPQEEATATILDGIRTWTEATGADENEKIQNTLVAVDSFIYYISSGGVLYTSQAFNPGATIRYDLYVPLTYGALGAKYNCIPDLSILSLTDLERTNATGDINDYGCVKVEYLSGSADTSVWKITLPQVISNQDPVTSSASKLANGFEPVGTYSSDLEKKFYTLEDSIYSGTMLEDNTLVLFDSSTKESYSLSWEKDPNPEEINITYIAIGPSKLTTTFKNNTLSAYLADGAEANTKHFFVFALGSNLSETVAQNTLNIARHKHNGQDSEKLNHNDLIGTEGNIQGFPGNQDGTTGELNFIGFNRQLAISNSPDNVHPQYLNRLGFLYGGSQGFYLDIKNGGIEKILDLNTFYGDFVFSPIESFTSGVKAYSYADSDEYDSTPSEDKEEKIFWDLDVAGNVESTYSDFSSFRSHAQIYGFPYVTAGSFTGQNATKLYYEPKSVLYDGYIDNKGQPYSLSRHGFIPGNKTTGGTNNTLANEKAVERGLNIGWGNLFFGHREDIFNGKLTRNATTNGTEASAFWRVGEFNILTTANKKAGTNTNSQLKNGYKYRDGFNVKATAGSNIWLNAGAIDAIDLTDKLSSDGKAPVIALEATNPAWYNIFNTGKGGLKSLVGSRISSGAGIFLSPSLNSDKTIPWVNNSSSGENSLEINGLWRSGSTYADSINSPADTEGSVLDIFNLAIDYNYGNNRLLSDIPEGQDEKLKGWIYGRPFIRGTYGINFCLTGDLVNTSNIISNGYLQKLQEENWGPSYVQIASTDKDYIHREFRFWGKQKDSGIVPDSDSLENTIGGNINLLYNFTRDYRQNGRALPWDSKSILGNSESSAGWSSSRSISFGSSSPESYGSAIRQASFVEAFEGFRSDPTQPYTGEYIYPFRVAFQINNASWDNPLEDIHDQQYVFLDDTDGVQTSLYDLLYSQTPSFGKGINVLRFAQANELPGAKCHLSIGNTYYETEGLVQDTLTLTQEFADQPFPMAFDGLVRGAEDRAIKNSGFNINKTLFPQSLIDFSVQLQYYIGYPTAKGISSGIKKTLGPASSPHDVDFGDFGKIKSGHIAMTNPRDIGDLTGAGPTTSGMSHPVALRTYNGSGLNFANLNYGSYGSGYAAMLTAMTAEFSSPERQDYRDSFNNFNNAYPLFFANNLFGISIALEGMGSLLARSEDSLYMGNDGDPASMNIPLPYRLYFVDKTTRQKVTFGNAQEANSAVHDMIVEFNGYVRLKFITANAIYKYGTASSYP